MIKRVLPILSLLISFSFFLAPNLGAQNYDGVPISSFDEAEYLKEQFRKFEVFALNIDDISNYVERSGETFDLNLQLPNSFNWEMSLIENDLKGPDFKLLVGNKEGVVEKSFEKVITFSGNLKNGGSARMTINDGFLYGLIEKDGKTFFIEPLKNFNNQSPNSFFVAYEFGDVIEIEGKSCGATDLVDKKKELDQQIHDHDHDHGVEGRSLVCYDVDIRLAADWSMNVKHGGVTGAVNHMLGVLNNVATNYDNEFNDELILISNSNFVSNCSTCDPWTTSTNASTLLGSFRSWGQNNGFGTTDFEAATLWTNRNLAGSTIGIAYVGAVCTSFKYNVCQDFTTNSANLRVLQAHELGHNFDAGHDAGGSPFIMAPSVNSSTIWSTASQNSINAYVSGASAGGCFNPCSSGPGPGGNAPVANFSSPHSNPVCPGTTVNFTDLSTNTPTSWSWSFPGGFPSTSSAQNPTVTYNTAGTYNVTLTATNSAGNDTETKINFVVVGGNPVAAFSSTSSANIATFTDLSSGIPTTWFWQFGDGNTSSVQNPTHAYNAGGSYVVTLTATNACGTNSVSNVVTVGSPSTTLNAEFTSNHSNPVCVGESVQFTDLSTGSPFGYSWSFPGGTPSFSSAANPLIQYNTPGTYDVSMTILSPFGFANEVKQGYVVVTTSGATAAYTFTGNNNFFTFTDQSINANTWLWDFGDGSTSSLQNPTHTYAIGGAYQVKLTASNGCGANVETKTVVATGGGTAPTANFTSNHNNPTCTGAINFTNTSTGNPTSYVWSFPGGFPNSSTALNPTVNYNTPGTYNVTLTATNASGSDTETKIGFVVVSANPTASFSSSTTNLTAFFTNSSTNATSYSWSFGDGNTSTAANPIHTYATAGTYVVVLTATNACGSNSTTQTVTVSAAVPAPVANFTSNHSNPICGGTVVNFTDTSTGNPTSWSWSFPGGSPTSSTTQNPTVTYTAPGTYNVTLTATNASGSDTETKFGYVVVSANPTAGFNFTTNNLTASFTNTSSNATSYSWSFGDGNTSTAVNPTHTYATAGTYAVTLTATNSCGSNSTTQTVTVSAATPAPVANFTSNHSNPICGGTVVNFTDTSTGNPTSWSWSFPGGSPTSSTAQNPTVTYNTPGTYNVTLTATNANGSDTETKFSYVVVSANPTASFTSSTNNLTATFTNTSSNATSYSWSFGDGNTSTAVNPTHTYAAPGTYTVTLTATNNCGSNATSSNVTVTNPVAGPVANFTSNHSNPICGGTVVNFTSTSTGNPTSYSWSFPGGSPSFSTLPNPSVTYFSPGSRNVTLTVTNAGGSDTETKFNYIVVASAPTANFTSSSSFNTVAFTNSSINGTSYAWNFGDGNTSSAVSPTHTYSAAGTYNVTLTATNACGSNSTSRFVTVMLPGAAPIASFTSGHTNPLCSGSSVAFTSTSTGNPTSHTWSFPGGSPAISSAINPTVTYSIPGTYNVTLTVSNASGTDTRTEIGYVVVTSSGPTAMFASSGAGGTALAFQNLSTGGATSYSWTFGDGGTSTAVNPVHTYPFFGIFQVSLTATNACGSNTFTSFVFVTGVQLTSIDDLENFESINVFPNPSNGQFTVEAEGISSKQMRFTVLNNLGQVVHRDTEDFTSGYLRKDFQLDLAKGMYLIQMEVEGEQILRKLQIH